MEENFTFEKLDSELGDHAPFMISLTDGEELRIVVSGVFVGEVGENVPSAEELGNSALHGILKKCRPIETNDSRYEICFDDYIMYQVRNESYCSFDSEEIRHGKYLVVFDNSKLLNYLSSATDVCLLDDSAYYPGEWKHYGIYTQNHVVDVVSCNAPNIEKL